MTSLTQMTHHAPVLGNSAVRFAIDRPAANTGHISLTLKCATSNGHTKVQDILEAPFQAGVGASKQDLDRRKYIYNSKKNHCLLLLKGLPMCCHLSMLIKFKSSL